MQSKTDKFLDYYSRYLSIDEGREIYGCHVCQSPNRDNILNRRFIYKVIITDFCGERIISISPSMKEDVINNICLSLKDIAFADILYMQQLQDTGYRISMMHRMVLNGSVSYSCYELGVKPEYLREYMKYLIRDKGDIISYCKISDLLYGFGNIVVWTDEKFRRRGYARELLLRIIEVCKIEGIEPIYMVDCNNAASIELAHSVGFEIVQTEIVGCDLI